MKVISNTSDIPTSFLRTVFCRVHNHLKKTEGGLSAWTRLKVTVRQGRKSHCSGYAYFYSGPITLTLARREFVTEDKTIPILTTRRLAWLFYHELMHVYGYKHAQEVDASDEDLDIVCESLPKYPPLAQVIEKPVVDVVSKRATNIDKRIETWERKLKRAQNALKKLKKQQKYYAKQAA